MVYDEPKATGSANAEVRTPSRQERRAAASQARKKKAPAKDRNRAAKTRKR